MILLKTQEQHGEIGRAIAVVASPFISGLIAWAAYNSLARIFGLPEIGYWTATGAAVTLRYIFGCTIRRDD